MSIRKSSEFLVNMKDVPTYNPRRHFYDQKKAVLDFYLEERRKIREGVKIGHYFVHPWLYHHVNVFKTPIPVATGREGGKTKEDIINPPLDDNMMYVTETYREAEDTDNGIGLFGTRGFSKSSLIASLCHWLATTKENGTTSVIGGDDGDLGAISALLETAFNNTDPAFYIPRLISDWDSEVKLGVRQKNGEPIIHSRIDIKNANKGKSKASEKGAGLSPVGFVADEIGKWNPRGILNSALPSFMTQDGAKLTHLLAGTGGNTELSKDAKYILEHPEEFRLLPMDWKRLEKHVPPEEITWEDSYKDKFCTYVPAQMSYRLKSKKILSNLSTYLGVEDKDLAKISINVTDWQGANNRLKEDLASKKTPEAKNKQLMYFPTKVSHCFLIDAVNPFNVAVVNKQIQTLESSGNIGADIDIYKDGSRTKYEFVKKRRAEVSHPGGVADAPIILYGELPETPPQRYENVAGHDGYKTDVSETDSLGTFYVIRRRNLAPNEPCERILASYSARPDKMSTFLRQGTKMLKAWNAVCLMESIDMALKHHLENTNEEWKYLAPAMSFAKSQNKKSYKGVTEYGLPPTLQNNEYRFNYFVEWAKEEHVVGFEEDGTPIIKYGVEFIDDIDLLKEMRDYKKGGNFDRIVAFSHALVLAEHYDKKKLYPQRDDEGDMTEEEVQKRLRLTSTNKYGAIPRSTKASKGKRRPRISKY